MSRINKPAGEWTEEELLGWALGEIEAGGQSSDRTIAAQCIEHFGLELIEDIDLLKAAVLELFEEAESLEEPTEEVENLEEQPLPEETEEVVESEESTEDDEPVAPEVDVIVKPTPKTFDQAEMTTEIIATNLSNYLKGMSPNVQISNEDGVTRQVLLYRTFQVVLRSEGAEFFKNLDLLLGFIAAHRNTLFSETNAFRFFQNIRLPSTDRKVFERLLNLFISTAVRETRQLALKQVDMARTVEGLSAVQQQRVIEYYSI